MYWTTKVNRCTACTLERRRSHTIRVSKNERLKALVSAHQAGAAKAAKERKIQEMEDKKFKYCLETGMTSYEDNFPHHLFEVKD